jgi:hypothetical protein
MAVLVLTACQQAPAPSSVAQESSTTPRSPTPTLTGVPTAAPTPQPTSPFKSDAYEYGVILEALETFGADLVELYDRPAEGAIDRLFTAEGKRRALDHDWRLRAAERAETWFRGDVSIRGWSTTDERPLDAPPTLKANIAFVASPGAELIDAQTGAVLEGWSQRQDFAMEVGLQYEAGLDVWRAFSLGPPFEFHDHPPGTPPPAVRCPGLGPDRPARADLLQGRRWCFGGRNGILATKDQVIVFGRYPCGTSRASIITLGWPVGSLIDHMDAHQFVRDPDGRFDRAWPLPMAYVADGRLPRDAYSTGLTDGEFEIWVSPAADAKAIWARHGDRIERWPRAPEEWGVIDCN